ncbi:Phosphate acyltransferase [Acholeplasma oculi]|uniref:Phosphate acyltransferase n=1 Tax=Acholeplasma oculi TaxID=35623 RepID=A0A061ABW1_9MOLU|nr:phosphate acyltransferase PlsX [Acholeplasma oculi]CDR31308.1 Phosphate acyltransferase PlsX [Acholeplasma oculi]SKC38915.1 phosphate:acyl-[acyl carrier protein] acyltransferase [Acholeplasma oculi]SUT91565.1 Phosphate acyltransferase [Acholeplasma oculi]
MIHLAIDAMGGDLAPKEIILGSLDALKAYPNLKLTLFGDLELMKPYLVTHERLYTVHAPKFFDMGVKDIGRNTLRNDKDTSMIMAMNFVKEGHADGIVSAGPTQALIFSSFFLIRPMKEMSRVAIAPMIPSVQGKPTILLDAGGNIDAKPEHLVDFAVFSTVVLKEVYGQVNPSVGLINIGTEKGKGREIDVETFNLLSEHKGINFYGNLEPKEILTSDAQILLSDGFTANIVMKTMEGTAKAMGTILKREIKSSLISKLAAVLFMKKQLKNFKKAMSADEVGGALIAGLEHVVVKAHGSSERYAFMNAIRQAKQMVEFDVINKVKKALGSKNE